ncbi:uncharacterized protein J3R85_017883 [Psidium guajava]|nr:uncharacterized protein J3R85_017883 [Psidium guajava]
MESPPKFAYCVFALPPDDLAPRLKSLMDGLRSEFGGPQFVPHITVVGPVTLTEDDAVSKFRAACDGLRAYTATVDRVATGTFFYQCVYLLLRPTAEVIFSRVLRFPVTFLIDVLLLHWAVGGMFQVGVRLLSV